MKKRKFAGIVVSMVMLLLFAMLSSAFALVYNPDDYQRWAKVQISSVFTEIAGTKYDGAFEGNCLQFVRLVIKLDNDAGYSRGWLKTYKWNDDNAYGRMLHDYGGAEIVTQHRNDYNGYPTGDIVEEHFSKAHAGDVVQMYWNSSQHTAIINGFEERNGSRGVHFFQANPTIRDEFYTFEQLAQKYTTPGSWGGFTIYCFGHAPGGERAPWVSPPEPDIPWGGSTVLLDRGDFPIKVYTLENRRYDVYSDKYLRNKLTSNWTDGSEEDWILDVGTNSEGVDYAYISIPLDNGNRKNVYVNLRDVFVKGSLNEPTHVYKDCRDFYRRRGSDYDSSYVLIADDATIFPLTRDNGWVQVCFWDWGENGGARIAWLTASEYTRIITVPPTITTTSLPDAYIGASYNAQVQATGTTPMYFDGGTSTTLANGIGTQEMLVGLCTDGVIRGTPGYVNGTPTNRTPPYTLNFPITVSNAGGEDSKTLSVTVYALPSINYTFKNGKTGETYSDYVSVSGGKSPYTWTKNSGTLPDGLSMSPSGSSLYLKGTPTKAETYNFSLKVKDANGRTATKSFTITTTTPPSITTNSLKDGIAGTSYSEPLSATGTTPITWSATGLPSGLSCSSAGKITGTPTSSGTFTVRVTASNTAGSTSKTLSLTIKLKPVAPTIDASLPECYVDEEYSGWIRLSGTSPITYSVSGLPSGLTRNSSTGNITGKATSAGSYTIKVNASNSAGSASKSYTLTVKTRPVAPTITTTSLSSGIVGQAYSVTLTATGTTPITWTASGLPGGLSCSTTGKISGTPTAAGSFSVTVTATNSVSTSKNFTLTINSDGGTITPEVEGEETKPEFKAHQPDLDGIIVVNFYVYMPEIAGVNYNNSYVNFKILNDTSYNPTQEFDPSFTAAGKLGTYYGFRCCVTSVQMADPITATLHYGNGKTVTHTYKLTDYLDKYYSASTTPALLKNVVGAMKDYGKYAQIALSEVNGWEIGKDHIETEAATLYTDSDIEETRQAVEDYAKSWNVGNSGIKSIGYRLALDADTILELFLRPAEGYTGKVSAYSRGVIGITDTGTNLAVKQSDGRYLVQISGIPAHRLDYTNTIRVVTDNGEFDVNVSALSYVNTILNSDKYNSNMKKAVTSLYRYHKAAKAYWESNQKK